ncbi:hypothetical protein ACFVUY_38265 [Kitasatospora sp. NPDC058063]|uniref:hypothetical protein n=1 Tax=unclassified Kitasatospora TaxID=2633591 RepID=UPI0036DC0588
MTIDPTTVPAAPLYTVTLTSAGGALLNGEEVPVPPGADLHEVRISALREVQIKAALLDRPVRVTAKEPDGSVWHMIVPVVGSPITLTHPHPQPAQPTPAPLTRAAYPLQQPAPDPTQPRATPNRPFATGPVQPGAGIARPMDPRASRQRIPTPTEPLLTIPLVPAAPSGHWEEPMPAAYRPLLHRMRAQQEAGDYDGALATAELVECALAELFGPLHPHTVNLLSIRAWLTYRRGADWAEAAEIALAAVERRRQANAPRADTERLAVDAYRVWRRLTQDDPAFAQELANRLVEVLDHDEKRAKSVIGWVESGAARPA